MPPFNQDVRFLKIFSPIDPSQLVIHSFTGTETLSETSTFQLQVLSTIDKWDTQQLLGQTATVSIADKRFFHGYINEISVGDGYSGGTRAYTLTMVPWLWLLKLNTSNRIFQQQDIKQICSSIFKQLGFNDFSFKLIHPIKPLEYCVQYNETDFNFVSRLLEEQGLSYYFVYEQHKHTLIITDHIKGYTSLEPETYPYSKAIKTHLNHINHWEHNYQQTTGAWTLNDYNYEKPSIPLIIQKKTLVTTSLNQRFEHYEYPGRYQSREDGEKLANLRMSEEEDRFQHVYGKSNILAFTAGGLFQVEDSNALPATQTKKHLLTSVVHRASDTSLLNNKTKKAGYSNNFTCVSGDQPFTPTRKSQKPQIFGQQSAIVVGPPEEEIYTDKLGRIKIQFHWDRQGNNNEQSSCWIRVSQAWAGNGWGTYFIPRIGQEVLVSFINGDPDRPVVTGSVYNSNQMPPYGPENKTYSGIKTRSANKGAPSNYNELRFNDKKDAEEVYIHAEKDFNIVVENDQSHQIQRHRSAQIEKGNDSTTVNEGNQYIDVQKGNRTIKVKESSDTKADTITLTATSSIELKVGSSSIKMTPSGITIKGMNINVDGKMTKIKGSAMVTIKGGITKIN